MRFSLPSRSPQFQVAGVGGAATPGIWNEAFTDAMGGAGSPFESLDRPKCRPPFVPGLAPGEMRLANGVAHTENLKLDLDNATVSMAGLMNLVDQSINLKLRTLLNKKLAEEVGGSRIGGYLTAAVAGPTGDMTIPSLVTGTFGKPRFLPDTAAIAKLKMQTVLLGFSDAIKGNKDGVKGIIDIFTRKKKGGPGGPPN